mmetsp:Transcript_1668/g.7435  ORF Transcript_1668/g.7435 Transcript_1668/m.7435 type:complete len:218 (+) Transcript_1668:1422-2075(+)
MSRISEVCLEIRDWPGACGIVLNEAAHCSNHCEPSVGNLLRAQGLLFLGALCHAHGVEKATSRVTDISSGAFTALVIRISMHGTRVLHILPAANFCPVHHKHLHNKQSVGVSDVPVKKRCISPVGERAVNKGIADDFRGSHACNTKHSPARVHELGLLIPRKRSLVLTWGGEVRSRSASLSRTNRETLSTLGGPSERECMGRNDADQILPRPSGSKP